MPGIGARLPPRSRRCAHGHRRRRPRGRAAAGPSGGCRPRGAPARAPDGPGRGGRLDRPVRGRCLGRPAPRAPRPSGLCGMGQPPHGHRGGELPRRAGADGGRQQRVRGHRRALGHGVARDDRHPRSRRDRGLGRFGARALAGVRLAPGVAYDPRGARAAFCRPPRLPVRAARPARSGGRGGAAAAARGAAMTRWLGLGLAAALAFALAVLLGPAHVPLAQLASSDIVRSLRLPRAVLALLVGGALGLAGASLQALVRNPLADPFLLGLSGGAGLGAVLAIALHVTGPWALPLAAFVGALAAMALVYRLGLVGGAELDPRVLILAGVAVGAFASAITTAIVSLSEATALRNAFLWLWGGLSGASWDTVVALCLYAPLPLVFLFAAARPLDLLALGEEPAGYLGVDVAT